MSDSVNGSNLIMDLNVNEYFNDAIHKAVSHQNISTQEETIVYIVNLLSHFAFSENVYGNDDEMHSSKPLALIYKDALEAGSSEARNSHLRKLGDTALLTSGFFAGSLERSSVGIDYFISMGGNAYSSLADGSPRDSIDKGLKEVFADLADHFIAYVDVLTEVSESNQLNDDRDVLSLYESWLSTGSEYARQRLQENGILTFDVSKRSH